MSTGYWSETLRKRLPRRRALVAAGGAAAATAFLAACGGEQGGGAKKSTFNDPSGLLYQPEDTSKEAGAGGTWAYYVPSEPPDGFDHYKGDNITFLHTMRAYQRLVSYKNGTPDAPPDGSVEGGAAASWEVTPDHLQITFKLRPNNKLDPRPPTNSRELTTDDVKYSWQRISSTSVGNGRELVNSINPDAPIISMTFPDKYTVVVKLKEPASAIMAILGYPWYFMVIPTEADGKYDVKNDMRGTGPWMITSYRPGAGFEFKKNPNYYQTGRPFMDGINLPLVTDTSQQLAQFKAKQIWGPYAPLPDLVVTLKRENPGVNMLATSPFELQGSMNFFVPSKLERAGNPFLDVRIRQAMSMLVDRDEWIDVFGNVPNLKKEGIPVETGWHEFAPASWKNYGVWHDPQDTKFWGEAIVKFWQHNPDEAAKLMKAAGHYPIETEYTLNGTLPRGTALYKNMQAVNIEMLQRNGHFKLKRNDADQFTIFDPKYFFGHGQYEGIAPAGYGSWPHYDMGIWAIFMPGGRNDYVYKPVPGAYELAKKHRLEFDRKKQLEIAADWSKAMGKEFPVIPIGGNWTTFSFHWPWLRNVGGVKAPITTNEPGDTYQHYWYDKSKDTRST